MSPGWTIDTHGPGAVADLEWNPPRPGYQLGEAVSHSSFSALITNAGNDLVAVVLQYRLGPFGSLPGTIPRSSGFSTPDCSIRCVSERALRTDEKC